jgi:hypothetical protein
MLFRYLDWRDSISRHASALTLRMAAVLAPPFFGGYLVGQPIQVDGALKATPCRRSCPLRGTNIFTDQQL